MFGRALFFAALVVIGAVLPYMLADEEWLGKMEKWFGEKSDVIASNDRDSFFKLPSMRSSATPNIPNENVSNLTRDVSTTANYVDPTTLPTSTQFADPETSAQRTLGRRVEMPYVVGPPGIPIEHLLSFEVTPEWISENWARVTTSIADEDLQGWRVPVARDDQYQLTGSVTYYFDGQRQVQRILLHGYTDDAANLVALATSRYAMQRVPCPNVDLFAAQVESQTVGALRCRFSSVLKPNMPKRCEIMMELNRNGSPWGMSYEFKEIFRRAKDAKRLLSPLDPTPVTLQPSASSLRTS